MRKLLWSPEGFGSFSKWRAFVIGIRRQHKQFNDDQTVKDFLPRDFKRYVEEKWQRPVLDSSAIAVAGDSDRYKYIMSMFPYPSGKLHMGHVRVYTISDVLARFYRLREFQVIHPMGWDAFGLPAENAALERNLTPDKWTYSNIAYMREQFGQLGLDFDWQREVTTCDPDYYRWTQSIFLDLLDAGLAYRANGWVNWDPVDQTVLAEEQVDKHGRSWRSGAKVEKKLLKQWFIRTTRFASELYEALSEGQMEAGWRDVVLMQRNWIGVPNGVRVLFRLSQVERDGYSEQDDVIQSWTATPHLLFKAAFLVLKPTHPSVHGLSLPETGPVFFVENPLTAARMPVFVVSEERLKDDFELEYPRDHDTWIGFPGDIRSHNAVAEALGVSHVSDEAVEASKTWRDMFNGSPASAPSEAEATEAVCSFLLERQMGGYRTSSRLRDWLISRQRFWGTPIPVVHCPSCGPVQVPVTDLPVKLPICFAMPKGASPLKQFPEWNGTPCPSCGGPAVRESDTMDTFMDSAWYFYRYLDPQNTKEPFSRESAKLLPVDVYVGGKDHAVLHLFYARFLHKFFRSRGLVDCPEPFDALCPVGQVMALTYKTKKGGRYLSPDVICSAVDPAAAARVKGGGGEGGKAGDGRGVHLVDQGTGEPVEVLWEKMSKSRHNGVDPAETVERIGVDTLRLLILDDSVPRSERRFSLHTLPGIERWQKRLVETVEEFCAARNPASLTKRMASGGGGGSGGAEQLDAVDEGAADKDGSVPWLSSRESKAMLAKEAKTHEAELRALRNEMTSIITHEIGSLHRISVAIRRMMGVTKDIRMRPRSVVEESAEYEKLLAGQVVMLAPLAPHLACELWDGIAAVQKHSSNTFNWEKNVLHQKWPEVDPDFKLNFFVLVNGREKAHEKVPKTELFALTPEAAVDRALARPEVAALRKQAEEGGVSLSDGCRVSTSDDYSVTVQLKVPQELLQ